MRTLLFALLLIPFFCTCDRALKKTGETASEDTKVTPENHDSLMAEMMVGNKYDVKTIGILVYDGVNSLDVFGPRYVLGQDMNSSIQLIALKPGNVKTVMGITFVPDATIDEVDSLDILVVPGGFRGTILATYNDEVHDWIRKIDKTTTFTAGVCTGGWILGGAGLLEDKNVSANWYRADEKMSAFGATFTGERFTRDGKLWTSAGVTAGMDMSLAILAELQGKAYAQGVMLDMEYDPAPPFPGGTVETTPQPVYDMMLGMYDMGVQPLVDSLEKAGIK